MPFPVITVVVAPETGTTDTGFGYEVGRSLVLSVRQIVALEPFRTDPPPEHRRLATPASITAPPAAAPLFKDLAWLGNADRELECRPRPDGYWIRVDRRWVFEVRFDGRSTTLHCHGRGIDEALLEEMLLGAPLMLALAGQGIFCLHASATLIDGRAVVFLGDSGQGKSTLAAYLDRQGYPRIADDIVPLAIEGDQPYVYCNFPQLKIPGDLQPGASLPRKLPLAALCDLDTCDNSDRTATLEQSNAVTGFLAAVHHTVAVRLFKPELTSDHMGFCRKLAEQTPGFRLGYPRTREALAQVGALLERMGS